MSGLVNAEDGLMDMLFGILFGILMGLLLAVVLWLALRRSAGRKGSQVSIHSSLDAIRAAG